MLQMFYIVISDFGFFGCKWKIVGVSDFLEFLLLVFFERLSASFGGIF